MLINNNKFIAGLAMISMNFGSRYVIGDVSKFQEQVLQSDWAKKFVLLCIFFISTRDIMTAFMLTFAFYFVVNGVFNENKKYNILKPLLAPFHSYRTSYAAMKESVYVYHS
jgi:hypothetical protein